MSTEAQAQAQTTTKSASNDQGLRRASIAGAVLTALAASACGIAPAVLAIVGLSGVGLASSLQAYRPLFLGGTAVLLAVAFYLTYRRPAAASAAGGGGKACSPRAARSTKVVLWVATVCVVAIAAYPHISSAFASKPNAGGTGTGAAATETEEASPPCSRHAE